MHVNPTCKGKHNEKDLCDADTDQESKLDCCYGSFVVNRGGGITIEEAERLPGRGSSIPALKLPGLEPCKLPIRSFAYRPLNIS